MENGNSPLMEAAVHMHELYLTLVAAGFTQEEALYIVAQSLRPSK